MDRSIRLRLHRRVGMAVLACCASGPVWAGGEPLTREALGQCAAEVQRLRSESVALNQQSAQMETERQSINERTSALRAQTDQQAGGGDLDRHLNLSEQRKDNHAQARAFNARAVALRERIEALNAVRDHYQQDCAQRPYRRSDFATLSAPAQEAMRLGLDGVSIPYYLPSAAARAAAAH